MQYNVFADFAEYEIARTFSLMKFYIEHMPAFMVLLIAVYCHCN